MTGIFISVEGTEGVGKTTLIKRLEDHVRSVRGKQGGLTREPGGTPIAEMLRSLLLSTEYDEQMMPTTELLLLFAARVQHVAHKIQPALQQGHVVLCDRYVDASFAYQVYGRGMDEQQFAQLMQLCHIPLPHLTLWLDAPLQVGAARMQQRGTVADRFEQEKFDFFAKVAEGYQVQHTRFPERIKRIDASKTKDAVFEQALAAITPFLG